MATTSLSIPSQSHMFAEVTFTPQTIQLYNAVFEVAMEGASRYQQGPRHRRSSDYMFCCHFFPIKKKKKSIHLLQDDPTVQEQTAGV